MQPDMEIFVNFQFRSSIIDAKRFTETIHTDKASLLLMAVLIIVIKRLQYKKSKFVDVLSIE